MPKTILIDMDDTIEFLTEAWCRWLDAKYNLNTKPEDIKSWDIAKYFHGLTKAQVFEPTLQKEFWDTVRPRQDAMLYIKKLVDEGHHVCICTASDYRTLVYKYEAIIEKYFPYLTWDNMIILKVKQMLKGDYLIDDGVHNLIGGEYKKILMSRPHNGNFDAEGNGMIRVNNWEEIYKIIEEDD